MALIKCPGCGKEISDKARKCVHCGMALDKNKAFTKTCNDCGKKNPVEASECIYCGCPFEKKEAIEFSNLKVNEPVQTQGIFVKQQKIDLKKIMIPAIAILLVIIMLFGIYTVTVIKPKNTYNEAMELLEKGKYEDADKLLDTIKKYKDVATIQEQLKYESYAYSAINSLKKYLKNPDSYQPYEIVFYASTGNEDSEGDTEGSNKNEIAEESEEDYPVCIMHYGAQNGFGGNTTGYALCAYSSDIDEYDIVGTCDSLDEDEYDLSDDDDIMKLATCKVINVFRAGNDTVGDIDLSRLKTVLKNDAYTTIKIIN